MKFKITLILLIIIIILSGIKSCSDYNTLQETINDSRDLINGTGDSLKRYKDLYGNEHVRVEKLVVEKSLLQHDLIEISKELKIKQRNIEGYKKITSKTEAEIIVKRDSFYADNYIIVKSKSDTLNISLTDSLTIVDYYKRKWFLGKKHYYIDISNTNKYVTIEKIIGREIKGKLRK